MITEEAKTIQGSKIKKSGKTPSFRQFERIFSLME
jgi:hypothetical protein